MILHCNEPGCCEIENIDVSHLFAPSIIWEEAGTINLDAASQQPPILPILPYKFDEIVETIQDVLPSWKTQIVIEGTEKKLHLTCSKHYTADKRIAELVGQRQSRMKCPHPYVGITGFKDPADLLKVSQAMETIPFAVFDYTVMLGITCSNKRVEDPHSEGKTSPSLLKLPELIKAMPEDCLPMIHYFTDKPQNMLEELPKVFDSIYPACCGLQINQTWPDPGVLLQLHQKYPQMKIVVQLSPDALLEDDKSLLLEKASAYTADYILMDPSGGQGIDFNLKEFQDLFRGLQEKLPQTRIGIAGGFSHENVLERYLQISEITDISFCVDAQGKLRTEGVLDAQKAISYLKNASLGIRNSKFGRN